MKLTFEMRQSMEHRQEQRLELKQLLTIQQNLREREPFPDAKTGLVGMAAADLMLKNKKRTGILVGGLSETIWREDKTLDDLNQHKDVDVLVLGDQPFEDEAFEGGIDWWTKQPDQLKIYNDYGEPYQPADYWANANGTKLNFRLETADQNELAPGLYLLEPKTVAQMREAETTTEFRKRNSQGLAVDPDAGKQLREKIKHQMNNQLIPEVAEQFSSRVLKDGWEIAPRPIVPGALTDRIKKVETIKS